MLVLRTIKRKYFYKSVKFANKETREFLYKSIFYFAIQNNLNKFEYITNYVSHATVSKIFKVVYPVIISGTSISKIQIRDAKGKIFNISLVPPNKIIYYEISDDTVDLFIGNCHPNKWEKRFYTKKLYYRIEDI